MKKLSKPVKTKASHFKQSRKQQRKEQRKEKKARKNEYYTNRKKPGKYVSTPNKSYKEDNDSQETNTVKEKQVSNLFRYIKIACKGQACKF